MNKRSEDTVLLPFERERFAPPYRDFLSGKRGACFNTIQAFPDIWDAFEMLDKTWTRAEEALRAAESQERILPVLMFLNTHVRVWIAFELAFSRCLSEAAGVLRNAIESAAYAHSFLTNPVALPNLGTPPPQPKSRQEGQERLRVYKKIRREFKKREPALFRPKSRLSRLHRYWCRYSERGSHMTFGAMSLRLVSVKQPAELIFHYNDAPKDVTYAVLISFLDCCEAMHELLFDGFKARLALDAELVKLSKDFIAAYKASAQKFMDSRPKLSAQLIWMPPKKA